MNEYNINLNDYISVLTSQNDIQFRFDYYKGIKGDIVTVASPNCFDITPSKSHQNQCITTQLHVI